MPMYEFRCLSCGALTAELCRMGEQGEFIGCSECGHTGLTRQISSFASPGVSGGAGRGSCVPGCRENCLGCH